MAVPERRGLSPWLSFGLTRSLTQAMAQSDISRTDCPRSWHGSPGLALASPAIVGPAHRLFSNSLPPRSPAVWGPGAELSVEGRFGFLGSPTPQADKGQAEVLGLTLRPLPWPRPCLFVQTDNRVFWTLTGNKGIALFCQLFLDGFGAVAVGVGWGGRFGGEDRHVGGSWRFRRVSLLCCLSCPRRGLV